MQIRPEQLQQSLAKQLAPVYLVAGAEPLLVQESRDLVLDAARRNGFLERTVYEAGKNFEWDMLHSAGMEQSLFSTRKVIDLRLPSGKPGQSGGKAIADWVKTSRPDVLLLISCDEWDTASRKSRWASDVAAAGVLIEIWPVKTQELPAWIERRMRSAGLRPEQDAVFLLANLAEGNLLAAQQEIDKLMMLDPSGTVSAEMIRQSSANNSRFDAFRLGECLLAGRADNCLKVAAGLQRTGVAIQEVAGALNYQLTQLNAVHCAVHGGESEQAALDRLRVFRMAQPVFRDALRRLSGRQIGDSFRALALIDRQGKGRASGDPWQSLNGLLLKMCTGGARPGPGRSPATRSMGE